jgi:multiple sugar transport system substrate-binding protein
MPGFSFPRRDRLLTESPPVVGQVIANAGQQNGQDIGKLYLDVLQQPAVGRNYMAYRTVKEFPLMGDVVNKAVERVVSGQMPAAESMRVAQEAALSSLRRSGAKV